MVTRTMKITRPTRARKWPNNAKEARDVAAEEAAHGLQAMKPLLEQQFTAEECIRRYAIGISAFQTILRILEKEGAQTRPF